MKQFRRIGRAAFLFLLAAALFHPSAAAEEIRIVVSIAPLAGIAREVAGEGAVIDILYPAGSSPLAAEPSPEALCVLSGSFLYLKVGAGLERRADRLIGDREGWEGVRSAVLAEGVRLIGGSRSEQTEERIFSAALGLDEAASGLTGNPFIWLDPLAVHAFAGRVAALLAEMHPRRRAVFEEGARRLQGKLEALDEEIRRRFAGIEDRRLATFSGTASYFCRRYGLAEIPVTGVTPGGGPGRQSLKGTVVRLRSLGVRAVFTDPSFPLRPAETAAGRAGLPLIVLEPFGRPGRDEGYFDTMNRLLNAIEDGVSP